MKPQVSMVVSAAVLRLAGSVWGSAWRQDETSPSASHSHTRMVRACVLDCTGSPLSDTMMGRWYTLGDTQPLRRVRTLAELSVRQTNSETSWQTDRWNVRAKPSVTYREWDSYRGYLWGWSWDFSSLQEKVCTGNAVLLSACPHLWLLLIGPAEIHTHTSGTEIQNTLHIHVGVFTSKNVYLPCSCAGTQENFVIVRY